MLPITPERITRLREFGLSEYAARTYLALLDLGVTEARDVSALSKVPASKIYHILDQLHEKGLVVILPEFPRKYAPVPFGEFLDKIHDEHEGAARKIRDERENLLEMFAVVGDVSGGDRGSMTLLRGRRNVLEKLDELLQTAAHDLLLMATPGLMLRQRHWAPILRAAAERGVRVRLLAPAPPDAPATLAGVEARLREAPGQGERGALVIADGKRALLAHFLPDDGHSYEGSDTAIFADQEGVVAVLASLAESPWAHAPAFAATHPKGVEVPLREP